MFSSGWLKPLIPIVWGKICLWRRSYTSSIGSEVVKVITAIKTDSNRVFKNVFILAICGFGLCTGAFVIYHVIRGFIRISRSIPNKESSYKTLFGSMFVCCAFLYCFQPVTVSITQMICKLVPFSLLLISDDKIKTNPFVDKVVEN